MAFDGNTIPRALLSQVMAGLANRDRARAAADEICVRVPVLATSGTVNVEPSLLSVPIGKGGGVAEGANVEAIAGALGSLNYDLNVYKQTANINLGDEVSANSVGYNLLVNRMQMCQEIANLKLDRDFETALKSTDLNLTYAVTTGGADRWDVSTSTPFEQIRLNLKAVPGSDTVILGLDVANALASHPDFVAESSNFSAGTLGEGEVANILKAKLKGIKNVFVIDRFYNSAAEGQALSLSYIFNDGFWLGHRSNLALLSLNTQNPRAINDMDETREVRIVGYSRRDQVRRPNKDMGMIFTSVIT